MKRIIFCLFIILTLIYQFGCDILDSENQDKLSEIQVKINNLPPRTDSSYVGWLTWVDPTLSDTIKAATKIFADSTGNFSERKPLGFGYLHDANSFIVTIVPDSSIADSTFNGKVAMYGRLFNKSAKLMYIIDESPLPDPLPSGNVSLYIDVVK